MSSTNDAAKPGHLREGKPFLKRLKSDPVTVAADKLFKRMYGHLGGKRPAPTQLSEPLDWKRKK